MDTLRVCGKSVAKSPVLIFAIPVGGNGVFIFYWYNGFILKGGS